MSKDEKLKLIETIIRIQCNCKFYEDEGRTEALKQECGRLSAALYIADDLGLSTEWCFYNANKYLEKAADFRAEEDEKAREKYKKNQKELKNGKK